LCRLPTLLGFVQSVSSRPTFGTQLRNARVFAAQSGTPGVPQRAVFYATGCSPAAGVRDDQPANALGKGAFDQNSASFCRPPRLFTGPMFRPRSRVRACASSESPGNKGATQAVSPGLLPLLNSSTVVQTGAPQCLFQT
jgi:hypothetical protein